MQQTSFDSSRAEQMAQLNGACRIIQEEYRKAAAGNRKNQCIESHVDKPFDMGFFTGRKFGWG